MALNYQLRRGDFDKAYAAAEHKFEHEFKTQKVLHLSLEPFACICDYKDDHVTFHDSSAGAVVRAHRDGAAARLAGEQGADQGAVSRLGLRRQALHQARGAGAGALDDRAQAREGRLDTFEEMFYQVTRHPRTFRIKSGVDKNGKIVARKCEVLLERRRLCGHRSACHAEGRAHGVGPYDIDNVLDRLDGALHQPDAGRCAARLRRAAACVGL